MRAVQTATFITIAFLVSGCSGGVGKVVPVTSRISAAAHTARVTFTMHWNSNGASAAHRTPKYVPVTAQSVSVSVNGGLLQYLNSPGTTLSIDAPVGTDQFVFATYDDASGQGNVLSRAAVTQSIVDGAANVVSAILEGVPASIAISLGNATPNAGTAATIPILASAKDADGNTIIGTSDYTVPITLTITDPASSGTLSLSKNALSSPASTANLIYSGGTLVSASVAASAAGLTATSATLTPTPTFYAYPLPNGASAFGIVAGPDGNMWFTDEPNGKIGRITPAGAVTEFPLQNSTSDPEGITVGTDGRIWFTEAANAKTGAITTAGAITEYATPSGCVSEGIAARGDGTLWYPCDGGTVNAISVAGSLVGTATVGALPYYVVAGPDSNMYLANAGSGTVSYLANPSSQVNSISTGTGSVPLAMVVGPDGAIWYTDRALSKIGRISTSSHSVTATFPTLTPNAEPNGITVGADGALWFTELLNGKIGRITTSGVVTEYTSTLVSNTASYTFNIASARDGSLWIGPSGAGILEKFVY